MDEVHVSWQGPEKPASSDLTALLSVRRRVVEKALVWLKRHNPLYANIDIDMAEMDSWEAPLHGVPSQVYNRLERNEPSAMEKTRTAHIVPPTERGLEDGGPMDVQELLASLEQGHGICGDEVGDDAANADDGLDGQESAGDRVHEISSSGMFGLDSRPDIADAEKLRYLCAAMGETGPSGRTRESSWAGSAEVRRGCAAEPYILVSWGDDFADSFDTRFFAKTFPALFPFGSGGPRQAEESIVDAVGDDHGGLEADAAARSLVSSRNMRLVTWAELVLQRHGGRFVTHHVFAFLVFNMGVRSRNRRVSMGSVRKKDFPEVERIVRSLTAARLENAKVELEASGKTADKGVNALLRILSLYGYRQPMSRENRLSVRRKIKSLIIRRGIPAIWFTLSPNDITNPVKLRLAAYRFRDRDEAEAFLRSLDQAHKRARLAISDPLSSAIFFHREISMFFKYYVRTGEDSVFGRISQYFGAVETNERGALHVHGLLWLQGNMHLSSLLTDVRGEDQAAYRERVIEYMDSVFTEDLDQEASAAVVADRSVASDISPLLQDNEQFAAAFDEEANFCAGATQIHTHSPSCVKYSIGRAGILSRQGNKRDLCRFRAPWKLVERTAFTDDGVLQIRRNHSMVNRWNKAMAVGLRHNHDISFIATKCKGLAIVFYVTNYATKVEDPVWKRVVAAKDLFQALGGGVTQNQPNVTPESAESEGRENRTRQFLMRVANRVFTERTLSQVEVVAHLQGHGTEFASNDAWTFLNVCTLYWHIFRRWRHLQREAGMETLDEQGEETILLEEAGRKISFVEAYMHRGKLLA
ncbi:hypothetical protein MPH_13842 [Macrophomina phaseolina MS6]|uniref:Uncharacterized protein n=1 Tax=Macrophomina phaseolina (strain MS6) TaxID=1126212 RepID=K2R4N2_MACPH|nr:hypothetical protein MPH_13842 [Macrophomina phaseolina MS6]